MDALHHVQLCADMWNEGKCAKGNLCPFAHNLGELREPTQRHLIACKDTESDANKWTGGEILPNKKRLLGTMSWAICDTKEGGTPPDWVLRLHWRCTWQYQRLYLEDVAALVDKYGPKKPQEPACSRDPEPHAAEGGAKIEGRQPHERRHKRKHKMSRSPPQKKKRHHRTSKEHRRDRDVTKEHHSAHCRIFNPGDSCAISKEHQSAHCRTSNPHRCDPVCPPSQTRGSDPHSGHCRTSKEHRRDRDHCGNSKEEPPTRNRTQPRELPEIHGHSSCNSPCPQRLLRSRAHSTEVHCHSPSYPKEAHPTESQARSKPQNRSPSPEESHSSYSSSSC